MKVKAIIYKSKVYVYTAVNRVPVRVSTGITASRLNAEGLLYKTSGIGDIEGKNKAILKLLCHVQDVVNNYPTWDANQVTHYIKTGEAPPEPAPVPEPEPSEPAGLGAVPAPLFLPEPKPENEEKVLGVSEAFERFIQASESGERLSEKGTRLEKDTIRPYKNVLTNLTKFSGSYAVSWENLNNQFYNQFCNYYWNALGCFDNYTGQMVKIFKAFLKWANKSGLAPAAVDTSSWKVWKEDIEIQVLYRDEIKLMYEMPIRTSNPETTEKLIRTRDIFLMGVFTCFRVQHLLNLTEIDLSIQNGGEYYITTVVQKTKKPLKIKLNPIGAFIIKKYRHQYETLLPVISEQKFNQNLKELATYFKGYLRDLKVDLLGNDWEASFKRLRTKRGIPNYELIEPDKFISSHCMRRSGINFLLMAGLSPFEVQTISGHAINSKEFAKYVKIANKEVERKSVDAWNSVLL